MTEFALLVLVPLLLLAISASAQLWRPALFSVMIFMVFEGALRKWIFPEYQAQLYFVKDFLFVFAIGGFLMERRRVGVHAPLQAQLRQLLAVSLLYFFLEIANPNSPSLLLGILGLKSYMLYAAMMFMVPYAFSSGEDFERKLNVYMLLMIPVALLGLAQFASPADSWLNAQVKHDVDAAASTAFFGEENRVRASGTFSYIGGYGTFVHAMFALTVAYPMSGRADIRRNWIAYVLLAATSLTMFTTGSRGAVYGAFGIAAAVLILNARAGLISAVNAVRLLVIGSVVGVVVMYGAMDAMSAFQQRAENSDDPVKRFLSPVTELVGVFDAVPLIGLGIGVTANAGATIMGTSNPWWLHGIAVEVEPGRVMAEVGLLGLLLVYGVRLVIVVTALRMINRLNTPLFKSIAASIAAFTALHLGVLVINNPTAGLYYWFAVGLLYAMYRLDVEPPSGAWQVSSQEQQRLRPRAREPR